MAKLAKNSNNIDSLMQLSTESFNKIDAYLRESGSEEISVLMMLGTWLEGAYIMAVVAGQNPTEEIKNRVAEQKESVASLYTLMAAVQHPYFQKIAGYLNTLSKLYLGVKIELILRDPEMMEIDGQLVIVDNSETIIEYSEDLMKKIITETVNMRNDLLKK